MLANMWGCLSWPTNVGRCLSWLTNVGLPKLAAMEGRQVHFDGCCIRPRKAGLLALPAAMSSSFESHSTAVLASPGFVPDFLLQLAFLRVQHLRSTTPPL